MPGYLRESCSRAAWTVPAFSTATSPWLAVSGRSGAGIFTVTGMSSAPCLIGCRGGACGAARIALERKGTVRPRPRIPAVQHARFGIAAQDRQGGACHRGTDQTAERREHAGFGAGGRVLRRTLEQATQAGGTARQDGDEVPRPPQRGSVDEGNPAAERLVVGEKAGGKIVGAVEQDVGVREQPVGGRGVESGHPRFRAGAPGGNFRLRHTQVLLAVEDLAREIGPLDAIGIDDDQPQIRLRFGERKCRGAAKSAGAEEHGGLHGAASSENSRSPGPLTIARPPWSCAKTAAAAPACDASRPSSPPTRARARAASARPTGTRSTSS